MAKTHLERAQTAKRESRYLDFKERFDPASTAEWCEVVKDLVAMANSGGGVIVVGAKNDGCRSGADVAGVLALDSATVTDKVAKYTGEQFADFDVHEIVRDGAKMAVIEVGAADEAPLVFIKPGTYPVGPKQQKTAFPRGSVYFRHGAKSEPASTADLRDFIERRLERVRTTWLGGIRKVITAPPDSEVAVLTRTASDEEGFPVGFRLTDEPGAPVFGRLEPDTTHPYRRMDALAKINAKLPADRRAVNTHDFQAVRAAHRIDETSQPAYVHKPRYGSRQYSDAFVEWFLQHHQDDPSFLDDARARYYEIQQGAT
jgi:hypothetical protein